MIFTFALQSQLLFSTYLRSNVLDEYRNVDYLEWCHQAKRTP